MTSEEDSGRKQFSNRNYIIYFPNIYMYVEGLLSKLLATFVLGKHPISFTL